MKRKVVVIFFVLLGYFRYHVYLFLKYDISYDYEAITENVSLFHL